MSEGAQATSPEVPVEGTEGILGEEQVHDPKGEEGSVVDQGEGDPVAQDSEQQVEGDHVSPGSEEPGEGDPVAQDAEDAGDAEHDNLGSQRSEEGQQTPGADEQPDELGATDEQQPDDLQQSREEMLSSQSPSTERPPSTPAAEGGQTPAEGSRPTTSHTEDKPSVNADLPSVNAEEKVPEEPTGATAASPAPSQGTPYPTAPQGTPHPQTPVQGSSHPQTAHHQTPPHTPAQQVEQAPVTPVSDIPPPPPMPEQGSEDDDSNQKPSPVALNMSWSFGLNKHIPVLNMTNQSRKMVLYVCAHTGVLYDFQKNRQLLLQGHGSAITCSCVSGDKRWLATADQGEDSMVIVWDSNTGIPVRTIFDPHPDEGVAAIAMTDDAKYIATLSDGEAQTLAIWDWTVEGEAPICTVTLDPKHGPQHYILFNPEDTTQIVTNSETQVIFYSWKGDQLEYFAPPLADDDFNKPVGRFSQSIFLSQSSKALTTTSLGNLVVWTTNKPLTKDAKATPDKKALKLVRLQEKGLTVITTVGKHIVTGDVLGHIKFFDQTLKLMNWYQDFHLGPINSISFAHWPEFTSETSNMSQYPPDATISAKQFVIKDFVVGTATAVYANITTDGTDVSVIHRDHDAAVHALASHPLQPKICVGSYSGLLKIWDYVAKHVVVSRWFDRGQMIRCCTFNAAGQYMAVGFTNGMVRVLDALSLDDVISEPFRYAKDAITHVAFSHNSQFLATADAEYTVTVFERQKGGDNGQPWEYLGRNKAHYKHIQEVVFGVQLDSDQPKLMSLSEDRVLVEYDLVNSTKDNLQVLSSDRIEQSAVPTCMAWYPPITKESFILTANDQFKLKLYNSTTKMCRKTLLGPAYGTPLQKIVILPEIDGHQDRRYLAYITSDKVGLHILPLDGNPHNAMALIAHPQGVVNLASSYNGKYLFTAGGIDSTVHMWDVNLMALEAQAKLGGEDLIPFYGLLDGGREGELFKELEDYFYYAQIRSQGVDTMDTRKVSTTVPLSEIPFVMRAMGFYPSEQEIEDLLNEVKYSNYVETGEYTTNIDLGTFLRLYINHRPAFGLQPEKLQWAFEVLGSLVDNGSAIERGDLLDMLQNKGEHMTEYELAEYLTTLLGYNKEGGSSELEEFDPSVAEDVIDSSLPEYITADMFANDLLSFGMYSDILQVQHGEAGSQ